MGSMSPSIAYMDPMGNAMLLYFLILNYVWPVLNPGQSTKHVNIPGVVSHLDMAYYVLRSFQHCWNPSFRHENSWQYDSSTYHPPG